MLEGGTDNLYEALPNKEPAVEDFIISNISSGDIFVDVGANVGYYTVLAAKLGAYVIAVEPVPETATILHVNVKLNDLKNRVKIISKCAYSKTTKVIMKVPMDGQYGLSSIYGEGKFCRQMEVEGIILDDVLKPFSTIKLVKVDAEGSELDVLKGMRLTLSKVDHIIIESTRNPKTTMDLLRHRGFKIKPMRLPCYYLASRTRALLN